METEESQATTRIDRYGVILHVPAGHMSEIEGALAPSPRLRCSLHGLSKDILLDTGATLNLLSIATIVQLKHLTNFDVKKQIRPAHGEMKDYSGKKYKLTGMGKLKVKCGEYEGNVIFFTHTDAKQDIIGQPGARQLFGQIVPRGAELAPGSKPEILKRSSDNSATWSLTALEQLTSESDEDSIDTHLSDEAEETEYHSMDEIEKTALVTTAEVAIPKQRMVKCEKQVIVLPHSRVYIEGKIVPGPPEKMAMDDQSFQQTVNEDPEGLVVVLNGLNKCNEDVQLYIPDTVYECDETVNGKVLVALENFGENPAAIAAGKVIATLEPGYLPPEVRKMTTKRTPHFSRLRDRAATREEGMQRSH